MPALNYRVIAVEYGGGSDHTARIERIAKNYSIDGPFILCNNERLRIMNFADGHVQDTGRIIMGKPYATIPPGVRYYESLISQMQTPRSIIAPRSAVRNILARLNEPTIFKGTEVYVIKGEIIHGNGSESVKTEESIVASPSPVHEPLEKPAKSTDASRVPENKNGRPTLADLLRGVS